MRITLCQMVYKITMLISPIMTLNEYPPDNMNEMQAIPKENI